MIKNPKWLNRGSLSSSDLAPFTPFPRGPIIHLVTPQSFCRPLHRWAVVGHPLVRVSLHTASSPLAACGPARMQPIVIAGTVLQHVARPLALPAVGPMAPWIGVLAPAAPLAPVSSLREWLAPTPQCVPLVLPLSLILPPRLGDPAWLVPTLARPRQPLPIFSYSPHSRPATGCPGALQMHCGTPEAAEPWACCWPVSLVLPGAQGPGGVQVLVYPGLLEVLYHAEYFPAVMRVALDVLCGVPVLGAAHGGNAEVLDPAPEELG